jgi:hypothetical protein
LEFVLSRREGSAGAVAVAQLMSQSGAAIDDFRLLDGLELELKHVYGGNPMSISFRQPKD